MGPEQWEVAWEAATAGTLVKWECGCIGLRPAPHADHKGPVFAVLLAACDDDEGGAFVGIRNMEGKLYDLLTGAQCRYILQALGALVADGHRLRSVCSALAAP